MQRLEDAAHALVNELRTRRPETPMGKTDAIDFLCAKGLKRAQARNLLEAYDAQIHHKEGRWILQPLPGTWNKTGVFVCGVNPGGKLITTDRRQASSVELNNPEVCRQPPEPNETSVTLKLTPRLSLPRGICLPPETLSLQKFPDFTVLVTRILTVYLLIRRTRPPRRLAGLGKLQGAASVPTCPTHAIPLRLISQGWYCTTCYRVVVPVAGPEDTV